MKKENLYNLSEYFTKENDSFAENLRYNLDICLKHSDITIHELAESAGISFDTLKNLLYQNSKDCKLSTAALLAKAIGVTVDELIGLDTIAEEDMDCITMFRQMPGHYQYFVRWFVRRQYDLSLGGFRQGRKTVPVMNLEEHPDGTLHISG
jgi:lambda repressor-like predicted transcriptional regulator